MHTGEERGRRGVGNGECGAQLILTAIKWPQSVRMCDLSMDRAHTHVHTHAHIDECCL